MMMMMMVMMIMMMKMARCAQRVSASLSVLRWLSFSWLHLGCVCRTQL
jgi:hypothetical protein